MSNAAAKRTSISDDSSFFISISALLYHPESTFAKIAITSTTPSGSPKDNCLRILFFRSRLFSQYPINPFSSSVSIIDAKLIKELLLLLYRPFKISIFQFLTVKDLKLPPLLLQYLNTHKRLDLPGIGTFFINDPVNTDPENHKHDKQAGLETVSFESNAAIKQSPELVQFIADQTGKIKALAAADLESHLALAQQFLNIGNPFLFEGIGNLVKIRSGEFALTSGTGMSEKNKEYTSREKKDSPASGESLSDYKKIFYSGNVKIKWRKPVVIILVIAGLALAVWGGYTVYKMTTAKNNSGVKDKNKKKETIPVSDTVMHQKDSAAQTVQNISAGMQKFILEVSDAKRAFERYGRLKTFQWNVQMETKDSVSYKLFLVLPASASDTSHIIDSLSLLNGRRVYIEQ